MTIAMEKLYSRDEWLEARSKTIGGSDAASVLGMSPYKTNVDLWDEKMGYGESEDISSKPYVKYGNDAEAYLRGLFRLDFPEYKVGYEADNIWHNDEMPWAHYSADGWLQDIDGRFGLLEIKTSNIVSRQAKEKWNGQIPQNYYVQILHGMLVTGAEFAVLKAQLKSERDGEVYLQTKHYFFDRSEHEADLEYLLEAEKEFYACMQSGKKPALILPGL